MRVRFGDVLRNGVFKPGETDYFIGWWCFVVSQSRDELTMMTISGDAGVMEGTYGRGKPFTWHFEPSTSWRKVSGDD